MYNLVGLECIRLQGIVTKVYPVDSIDDIQQLNVMVVVLHVLFLAYTS